MTQLAHAMNDMLVGSSETEQVAALSGLIASADPGIKQKVLDALADGPSSSKARDHIWKVTIWALAIVLVVTSVALALGMFLSASGLTKPDTILTVITTIAGFLAGFFAPSPLGNGGRKN